MEEQYYVLGMRLLLVMSTLLMSWWSIKSFIVRCRIKVCDFSDFSLVVVAGYWLLYSLWSIIMGASIETVECLVSWTFNMRVGLFLTVIAFTALIKDRLLVSSLYEALMAIKDARHKDEDGLEQS